MPDESSLDPTVLVLQVVRSDITEMRGELRQDIKDMRDQMVTQAEHRATEKSHEREHQAMRQDIDELRAPARWPNVVSGIGAVVAMAVAIFALLSPIGG